MSGTAAILASNRAAPTPAVVSNFAKNRFDWETLSTLSAMPTGGTISRSGNAMVYDSTGRLTWAPNNLLLQSQDMSQAAWNAATTGFTRNGAAGVAPDGTNTASFLQETTAANSWHFIYQSGITPTANTRYLYSVYVKNNGTRYCYIQYALGGVTTIGGIDFNTGTAVGTASVVAVSNGWYRLTVPATTTSAAAGGVYIGVSTAWPAVQYTGSTSNGVLVWGAQLEACTYESSPRSYLVTTDAARYAPRFDVAPLTGQAKGLLLEGARTNLLTYSEQFDNAAWTKVNSGITPNQSTAPDGTNSADLVTVTATAATYVYVAGGVSSAGTYTFSIYAKAGTTTNFGLYFAGGFTATYVLSGSGTATGDGASIQSVGSGWYRCSLTATVAINAAYGVFRTFLASDTFSIWGAQIEAGAWASSYLPTGASTTSRAAETFTLTGYANRLIEAYWIEQETGVASSFPETVVSSGAVTINPPQFGWVTSLRAYTNAYAGDITTPSWIDNIGTNGNRMVTDSTGTLTWAPANMLLQSQTFDNASWDKTTAPSSVTPDDATAPDGTSTADKIVEAASTARHGVQQTVTFVNGLHMASVYAKAGERSFLQIGIWDGVGGAYLASFNLSTGALGSVLDAGVTAAITSAGNGWYRCSILLNVANAGSGTVRILETQTDTRFQSYLGDGTSGLFLWGAQLERVTYQTQPRAYIPTTDAARFLPRYDFDAATTPASPLGMRIEEARTNLFTRSQQFGNAIWIPGSISVTEDQITAPDGTLTADLITATATGTLGLLRQVLTLNATADYTVSVYAKSGTSNILCISPTDGTDGSRYWFNLTTGTVGSTVAIGAGFAPVSASIANVGNGWFRCAMTFRTRSVTSISLFFSECDADASLNVTTGKTIYLWGAQVEAGAFATSYIPTTTGTSLRVADVVKLSGTALTVAGAATGSAIVQTTAAISAATSVGFLGSNSARRLLWRAANNNTLVENFEGTLTMSATIGGGGSWTGGAVRAAVGWSSAGRSLVANNGTLLTDAKTMGTGTDVYLGAYGATLQANAWLGSLALYNTRLPDATLKQKSAVGAAY